MLVVGAAVAATVDQYYQTAFVEAPQIVTYMDSEAIPVNGTIDWGTIYAGSAYEFNFTVLNNSTQNFTVSLIIISLPSGWGQTWLGNNTLLLPYAKVSMPLVLTVPANAASKRYDWQHQIVTSG
jgi:hypothetical protein